LMRLDGDCRGGATTTESLERLKRPFGLANGTPLSDLIAWGRPRSWKSCSKAVMARFLAGCFKGFAEQEIARGRGR